MAPAENSPGAVLVKGTDTGALAAAPAVTVMAACAWPANSHGTWKLIWVGETKNSGASLPPTRTTTPPSNVGNGADPAVIEAAARSTPNSEAMEPADNDAVKLAPFTTPPGLMPGAAPGAAETSRTIRMSTGATGRRPQGSLLHPQSVPRSGGVHHVITHLHPLSLYCGATGQSMPTGAQKP